MGKVQTNRSSSSRVWRAVKARLFLIRPGVPEAVMVAALSTPLLFSYSLYQNDPFGYIVEVLLCVAAASVGRFPLASSIGICAMLTLLLVNPADTPPLAPVSVLISITSLGARNYNAAKATVSLWLLLVVTFLGDQPEYSIFDNATRIGSWITVVAVAWIVGWVFSRMEDERKQLQTSKARALSLQRRAIAQDLHDTVAYSTTSIIMRAEQARLRGIDDPALAEDLDFIIASGRQSMRDLRSMVETLRRNQAVTIPDSPWRISSLNEVVESRIDELKKGGFDVSMHTEGSLESWPDSVRQTLAKVFVEATGNMLKHGDPDGRCSILIDATGEELEAVFINRPRNNSTNEGGFGLLGATERVQALGGSLHVSSRTPRWIVQVRLPKGA